MTRRKRRGPAVGNGGPARNASRPADDSARHDTSSGAPFPAALAALADRALATGDVVIGDGVLAVPDLVLVEGIAHRLPIPETFKLVRDDGRSVAFYKWPGGGA